MSTASRKTPRPPARRTPRQARAHSTVAVILEAALDVLRRHGLAGFNTNRIAERAGVSIGTLYGYFPNKQTILIALARQLLQADGQAVLAALRSDHLTVRDVGAGGHDGHDPVRRIVRALFARHRDEPRLRRTLLSVYLGAGLAGDDDAQVRAQVAAIAAHPGGPLAGRTLSETQLFVISRAVLGIARGLVEDAGTPPGSQRTVEDETVRLVQAYLALAAR